MNRIICIILSVLLLTMTGCSDENQPDRSDAEGNTTGMSTDEVAQEPDASGIPDVEGAAVSSDNKEANGAAAPAVSAADPGISGNGTYDKQAAQTEECSDLDGLSPAELIELIKNGNERESVSAQEYLSLHGAPDVEEVVRTYIDACKIITNKEMGEDEEAEKLLKKFGDPKNDPAEIRSSIGNVLSRLGEPSVRPLLKAINNSDLDIVRNDVTSVIQNIGEPAVETLIASMDPDQYEVSLCIIEALGYIGDPRAIDPLMSVVKGEEGWGEYESEIAMYSLEVIGKPAVEPLIELLQSKMHYANESVQADAAEALGIIGDTSAVDPLVEMLDSKSTEMRMAAAKGLAYFNDIRAVKVLEGAMSDSRLDIIAGACMYFIRKGEPSSEDTLIKALNKYGDSDTAVDFLNSGNEKLEEAGRKWADDNGYFITTIPGVGGSGTWGSGY